MRLSAADILAAPDLPTIDVEVPEEWGGTIRLGAFTVEDALYFEKARTTWSSPALEIYPTLVALCLIDGEGNRPFRSNLTALYGKNPIVLKTLGRAAAKLNNFDFEGDDKPPVEEDRETELAKNS